MKNRTYSKEEIASLLERAAELHAQTAKSTTDKPGLTLTEVEEIAAESGIDPLLVRQAASEMSEPPRASLLQTRDTTATHNVVERIIPGSLRPDVWEDIVMDLRHRFDTDMGKSMGAPEYGISSTEQIGRSVEWKHTSLSGIETRALIRPRGDKLHLRLSQRVGWGGTTAESVTYGSIISVVTALIAGGVADSGLIAVIVAIAALAAFIPLIAWADKAWRKKKHRELDALGDRISNMIILAENDPIPESETIDLEDYASQRIDDGLLKAEEPEQQAKSKTAKKRTSA